jgi:hypothetical protein
MSFVIKPNDVPLPVLQERQKLNTAIEAQTTARKRWFEYPTVAAYRLASLNGETGWPKLILDAHAQEILIPSSHGSHSILLRRIPPREMTASVFLHFHAGKSCSRLVTPTETSLN